MTPSAYVWAQRAWVGPNAVAAESTPVALMVAGATAALLTAIIAIITTAIGVPAMVISAGTIPHASA
jgi:hypothetical protein